MTAPVGRGGLKLEAAIERFRLEPRISDARAVDVGASTGGFTEALLRHGATHVTAVDVGTGQLHPSLQKDPRVENLEGVHWKTLALSVAPGPFDFFTVDVSFVAARTMLRGLAFRLRPGAEGVVLVKPQFELPDHLVKGGNVTDPQLRARALAQVVEKAEALGFELVEQLDSPVAGREGTVEILAHLRFRGRSERLPQPGEKRAPKPAPARKAVAAPDELRLFAVAAPGLEPIVARELAQLEGARAITPVPGGVELTGDRALLAEAHLWLRTATRVLVRLGEIEAREFPRLRRSARNLPWAAFLDPTAPVELHVSQTRCRLYHTGAVAETLELAIGDALGAPVTNARDARVVDATRPASGVYARGQGDRWTLSVDASGELLHKRGWREESAAAPLRETLAAALLQLAGWDPTTPLVDPMCGAGTIPLEAAQLALRRAPGLDREFAFQRWPGFDAAAFAERVARARGQQLPSLPAAVVGSDHAAAALEAARRNAERAGLAAHVQLQRAELGEVKAPPGGPGLVLTNPPYGKRVGDPRALRGLYTDLGRLLRRQFAGWRAAILVADPRLASALGLKPRRSTQLQNGGLRVHLLEFGDTLSPRNAR